MQITPQLASVWLTRISHLPGVGIKRAAVLESDLEITTYLDLIHNFPYKYVDRSRIYRIGELRTGMQYVQLMGTIRGMEQVGTGRKRRLKAMLTDQTGSVELVWFRDIARIQNMITEGRKYLVFGKPALFNGAFNIAHPELDHPEQAQALSGGFLPMYTITEGMKRVGITQRVMRTIMSGMIQMLHAQLYETLPPEITSHYRLIGYPDAIHHIHFPPDGQLLEQARRRLKFEELFFLQLKLQTLKIRRKSLFSGYPFPVVGHYFNTFYKEHLPFALTDAQKRVIREVRTDMNTGLQMNRLVQGDVGSGKTLVALMCMLLAADNGYQACLMAPTEILARQHHKNLNRMLAPLGIEVGLLVGSSRTTERRELLPALADGKCCMVVGTHALIEENVQFHRLGLAVIDEQHRFGVAQRARLWQKGIQTPPHILIMSATPIPRTLAMTLYGDLDISVIDQLPPGRKPIRTYHHFDNQMTPVYQFIRRQVEAGHQAYVVYPMINEREDIKSVEEGYNTFVDVLPDIPVTWVHGRLSAVDKDARMQRFASGEIKVMLATTVIEVGVDVPNATLMIIEGAERFGLSQLHQLRGRVGRGADESYCILITGTHLTEESRRRMEIMVDTNDGFVIAEEDMKLRGFGELEGTRQSGRLMTLRIANPSTDSGLVQLTREIAEGIFAQDPELASEHYRPLHERLNLLFSKDRDWGSIS